MSYQRNITCCFTGHRPDKLGGYNEDNPMAEHLKEDLHEEIRQAIVSKYMYFITGMAQGWDTWAAESVLKWKEQCPDIKLIAAIPFEGQESKWPEKAQQRYRDILAKADTVEYIHEPGYAAWKNLERNKWMVDRSSLVIAGWDGSDGGTGHCVHYVQSIARAEHIDIVYVDIPEQAVKAPPTIVEFKGNPAPNMPPRRRKP